MADEDLDSLSTHELHDRAGEFTSVLFTQRRFPTASELLQRHFGAVTESTRGGQHWTA